VFLVAYVIVEFHFFASALYFVADVVEWSRVSVCRCVLAGLQWWTRVVFAACCKKDERLSRCIASVRKYGAHLYKKRRRSVSAVHANT
jgi:hypothetical protein